MFDEIKWLCVFTKYTTKINMKNLWKCVFRASRRVRGEDGGVLIPLRIFVDCYNIQFKPYWLLLHRWGFIDPTLKCIDQFVLKQKRNPSGIYMFWLAKNTLEAIFIWVKNLSLIIEFWNSIFTCLFFFCFCLITKLLEFICSCVFSNKKQEVSTCFI